MNGAELGIVVATYPEGSSIDVVMIRDGSRLSNVQVATSSASTNTGIADLADIGAPSGDARWDITQPVERLVRGIIMFVQGVPICTGFLFPQVGQMAFHRKNFKVERHASDVYSTINANGDMETYHPSGTYFRIGSSPAHEDLTGQDYDQHWKIAKNTGSAVHAHLAVANAGSVVATVDIDPQGNVTLMNLGKLTSNTTGDATLSIGGQATVNVTGNITFSTQGVANISANGSVIISSAGSVSISGAPVSLN